MYEFKKDNPIMSSKVIAELRSIPSDNGLDLLTEILDVFIQTSEKRLTQLQRLAESQNVADFKAELHALKSSALTIGAFRLVSCCEEFEADSNLQSKLNAAYQKLKNEVGIVVLTIGEIKTKKRSVDSDVV